MPADLMMQIVISVLMFAGVAMFVRFGWAALRRGLLRQEERYARVLNKQLLLSIRPRTALILTGVGMAMSGLVLALLFERWWWFMIGAGAALAVPHFVVQHFIEKRRDRLDEQLVDGITTLASGVRAGLNLVQSMELLVANHEGPLPQEFDQLLREYQLGVDLDQAMLNASNRIGSQFYRLLFGAIQAHRQRGGDMGESLDRIADSVREIQRLEGRLKALTAQGRAQARMMGIMPIVILCVLYAIAPEDSEKLITEPLGRLVLLISLSMIVVGFLWIRRIMAVDI